jgi:hypothetical protein
MPVPYGKKRVGLEDVEVVITAVQEFRFRHRRSWSYIAAKGGITREA